MKIGPLEIKLHRKAQFATQPNMVWQCPACKGITKLSLLPDGRTLFQAMMDIHTTRMEVATFTCSECGEELKIMAFDQVVVELSGMAKE